MSWSLLLAHVFCLYPLSLYISVSHIHIYERTMYTNALHTHAAPKRIIHFYMHSVPLYTMAYKNMIMRMCVCVQNTRTNLWNELIGTTWKCLFISLWDCVVLSVSAEFKQRMECKGKQSYSTPFYRTIWSRKIGEHLSPMHSWAFTHSQPQKKHGF